MMIIFDDNDTSLYDFKFKIVLLRSSCVFFLFLLDLSILESVSDTWNLM